MNLSSKFAFLQKKWIDMLLVVSSISICLVHALPAGIWADFAPTNGDFQNYNVVRRVFDGQIIYSDFTAYLGFGHLVIGSLLTFLFGLGSPSLLSSKMAFQFAAIFSFACWVYAIFRAVFYKSGRTFPLAMTNFMLLLVLINPPAFVNTISVTDDFYNGMMASLSTGNSARFLRELAPVIFVVLSIFVYWLTRKIKFTSRSNTLSFALIFGVPAGIIVYYSNDYGIASAISISLIFLLITLFNKTKLFLKLNRIYAFALVAVITFIAFGTLISGGHFPKYLSSTFGTGGAQGWYYNGGKSYYLWDMDLSFWTCIQAVVILMYLVILLKKRSKESIIRYGIPLFFNMTAYAAENEYKLLSGEMLHEVSYTVLYLTLLAEACSLTVSVISIRNSILTATKRIAVFIGLSGIVWSLISYIPLRPYLNSSNPSTTCLKGLGCFSNAEWAKSIAKSIKSTDEFLKNGDVVFSTYSSGLEAYRGTFQPSGTDYIIHVLGNSARSEYLKKFRKADPNYVVTFMENFVDWEYWVKNANWFFYRELYQHYMPKYANDYQMFWTRKENNNLNSDNASLNIDYIDDHTIKISVLASNVSFGIADVNLKYSIKKKSVKQSLFTFNTMVFVDNQNSYALSGNHLDRFYYLSNFGDGTSNTAIGIPIINGIGSVILTCQPSMNTKFENFEASLVGNYSGGYFNSIVVLKTEKIDINANLYRLTIANTPNQRKIVENAWGVRIGDREYEARFNVDGNNIFIDTLDLDNNAMQFLLGHSYYPIIQVINRGQ